MQLVVGLTALLWSVQQPSDDYAMRTESDIQKQIDNILAQLAYITDTVSTAEEQDEDGVVYDADFVGDYMDMSTELNGMLVALEYALGRQQPQYGDLLVPANYAQDMCTGHGYPQAVES